MRFDNAQTRRGLSFARSRHAAPTQRVLDFAFRQRPNMQRVVVRAITTRRIHAEDHRFCISTTPKHAEGLRFGTFLDEAPRLPPTLPRALKHFSFKRKTHQNPSRHEIHQIHHTIHHVIHITALLTDNRQPPPLKKPSAMLSGTRSKSHRRATATKWGRSSLRTVGRSNLLACKDLQRIGHFSLSCLGAHTSQPEQSGVKASLR